MTEKRFWYDFEDCDGPKIVDFKKDKEYPVETIGDFRGIEELLNSLNDENVQLKQRNNFLKEQLDRVCSENEIIGDKLKKIGRIL